MLDKEGKSNLKKLYSEDVNVSSIRKDIQALQKVRDHGPWLDWAQVQLSEKTNSSAVETTLSEAEASQNDDIKKSNEYFQI